MNCANIMNNLEILIILWYLTLFTGLLQVYCQLVHRQRNMKFIAFALNVNPKNTNKIVYFRNMLADTKSNKCNIRLLIDNVFDLTCYYHSGKAALHSGNTGNVK